MTDDYKDKETLDDLYWGESRHSVSELAEKFDVNDTTIRYWMKKHSIERRGRGRRPKVLR